MSDQRRRLHTLCSYCGHEWPRGPICRTSTCTCCGETTYVNAKTVAVMLQPVRRGPNGELGLIGIERAIERKGPALPGGFQEIEDVRVAAARELAEETQILIRPEHIITVETVTVPEGHQNLVACLAPPLALSDLPLFVPTMETTDRFVLDWARPLVYPIHEMFVARFFSGYYENELLQAIELAKGK